MNRVTTNAGVMRAPAVLNQQPELWGGVECTVNRVGDTFFDQLERSGHAARLADLDLFSSLGIRSLRYPVLWERTAPNGIHTADWSWPDQRLGRLRELGIRPIVGLVHHGSGPHHTSLVDPSFAMGLADYARAVATRYPWVSCYTPVNEPLTTARFSGLYGHWYPHGRDELTFCRALLNQCRAVVLAMQAIREINPGAQLIQTEDLGKTFSTPRLAYQAEFENSRRWISFDLLCGRVDHNHPMFDYLRWVGIEEDEITWFLDHPCPPDVFGINYYLTSERFLDEDIARYPGVPAGGNGQDTYVDVEAVRVRRAGIMGPGVLLRETWERYGRPLAVTEAHLGCTREEQLRWFYEVWQDACMLRRTGVDLRAVTAWSLLGAYDWHTLVTRDMGHYEPGVFDLRGPTPRPTALATLLGELAAGRVPDHSLFSTPGWWRRPERLSFGFSADATEDHVSVFPARQQKMHRPAVVQPLLITNATTPLGRATRHLCEVRGLPYRLFPQNELDITDPVALAACLEELRPWAIVNTPASVALYPAAKGRHLSSQVTVDAGPALAAACAGRGIRLLTFSSDLVFDGQKGRPYVESDPVAPLNAMGRAQAMVEERVLASLPAALVIRTSGLFGPWDTHNVILAALQAAGRDKLITTLDDTIVSPTFVPDLVHACLDLLIDGEQGLWHLVNAGAVSWAELVQSVIKLAGIDSLQLTGQAQKAPHERAGHSRYQALTSERGMLLPQLDNALARYVPDIASPRNVARSA